jgi:hypothetical protein
MEVNWFNILQQRMDVHYWKNPTKGNSGLFTVCWEWNKSHTIDGYGRIRVDGVLTSSHVLMYKSIYGDFSKRDLNGNLNYICHHCDNPRCGNPDHLFLSTPFGNYSDMKSKGRGNHPHGESFSCSKLTENQVIEIIEHLSNGMSQRKIASMYGVGKTTIAKIHQSKTWNHIFRN